MRFTPPKRMRRTTIYFAPLEGITNNTYRNTHHDCYAGVDAYFTPFLSPNQHNAINPKEKKDILPENNKGVPIVPQVLTNKADYLLRAAKELKENYGYEEVNLNLGCPSKTVVSKGKGSGFLKDLDGLKRFFDDVFETVERESDYPKISVKTRLGLENPEEFAPILQIYNQYPLSELIIHPRVQKEFYKNTPHLDAFAQAVKESKHSLCYNGDIYTLQDYLRIREMFPTVEKFMMGRGLLSNPSLAEEIRAYEEYVASGMAWTGYQMSKERMKKYHNLLYDRYVERMSGDTNVLFKMKEFWVFLGEQFPEEEKLLKKIKKANRLDEYERLVGELFEID